MASWRTHLFGLAPQSLGPGGCCGPALPAPATGGRGPRRRPQRPAQQDPASRQQKCDRLRIGIGAPAQQPQQRKARTVGRLPGRFSSGERPVVDALLAEVISGTACSAGLGSSGPATASKPSRASQPSPHRDPAAHHQGMAVAAAPEPLLWVGAQGSAAGFQRNLRWAFERGELSLEPCLGRALIQDALLKFLQVRV